MVEGEIHMKNKELQNSISLKFVTKSFLFLLTLFLFEILMPEPLLQTLDENLVVNAEITLSNPDVGDQDGDPVTWDCIWFGTYPQTEIVDKKECCGTVGKTWGKESDYEVNKRLYRRLQYSQNWDADGNLVIDEVKYKRIKFSDTISGTTLEGGGDYTWDNQNSYHYFRYDPIKWRVLNVINEKVYLLADKILDTQKFDTESKEVTWKDSTIRNWLNTDFLECAFSEKEKNTIRVSNISTKDEVTKDKIYLLSSDGVAKSVYGFANDKAIQDVGRLATGTTYAKAMGLFIDFGEEYEYDGISAWWLRSMGYDLERTARVFYNGLIDSYGNFHDHNNNGIRPALSMITTSSDLFSWAGTVCSDGTVNEVPKESDPSPKEYFVIGRDSNNFLHIPNQFCNLEKGVIGSTYPVSPYYYGKLVKNLTWTKELELLDVMNKEKWTGSCEGLSISLGLVNMGELDIGKLKVNGIIPSCYNDLEPPLNNLRLRNLINYYTLLQCADKMPEPKKKILNLGDNVPLLDGEWTLYSGKNNFWDSFTEYVRIQNQKQIPILFSFGYRDINNNLDGHTILTCGYEENEQYKIIKLYDCNLSSPAIGTMIPGRKATYLYLFLDKNNYDFYFSSTEDKITPVNDYAENDNWHDFEYYDADVWETFDTEIEPELDQQKSNGNAGVIRGTEQYHEFSVDAGKDFKLTDSKGNYLLCQNGQLSGNLKIYEFDILKDQSMYQFKMEKNNSYTINVFKDGTRFAFDLGDNYYSIEMKGVSSILIDKKGIDVKGASISGTLAVSLEKSHSLIQLAGNAEKEVSIQYETDGIRVDTPKFGEISIRKISRNGTQQMGKINGGTTIALDNNGIVRKSMKNSSFTKIEITGMSHKIALGKKLKLSAKTFPKNVSAQKLIWTSSNSKIATVNQNGLVKIKNKKINAGKSVTITVQSVNNPGIKGTFIIKVMKGVVKKIKLQGKASIKAGKRIRLKAKVVASKGANKRLIWKSSNEGYASVSSKGYVKTRKEGKGKKVRITAMATDGSNKKKTVTIQLK